MSSNNVLAHLYRTRQVAAALGVTKKTIYRWLEDRLMPEPHRTSNGYRIWTEQEVQVLRKTGLRRRRRAAR